MISIGFSAPNITASIINTKSDTEFRSSVSILKNQKFAWNPETMYWEKPAVLYTSDMYDVLRIVSDVYFPQAVREQIENYPNMLPSELERTEALQVIDYSQLAKDPFRPVQGKAPYENYQDEDIRRALSQNRFLFNWEMGLGKSFATAIIYEYLRVYKNVNKMILITSRIGTYNLKAEMFKFCKHIELEDVLVFNSPKSFKTTTRKIFDDETVCSKSILVFSYDSWKLVASAYGDTARSRKLHIPIKNFFGENSDALICLDECHYLSNPKSERSKSLFKYLRHFKYRYLFSATPADKPEKLYSLLLLLDPKLCRYLKYNQWLSKYNDMGTWFSPYAINKKGWHEEELRELNEDLAAYSAKRLAVDVLDLPDNVTKTYEIDMSEKLSKLYKSFTNDIVNNIIAKHPDLESAAIDVVKEAFSTVMSFTENPNILAESASQNVSDEMKAKCAAYNFCNDYAKLDVVDAIVEDECENEQRGILWYIHPKTKDVIVDRYKKYKPVIVSAELSEEERVAAIQEFINNPEHKLLIASQYILATSVTLICCTYAIYLETAFAYETYSQSRGRIFRIGQDKNVRFYHIWYKNSTDLYHIKAIENKKDFSDMIFSVKEKLRSNLQMLKALFSGEL